MLCRCSVLIQVAVCACFLLGSSMVVAQAPAPAQEQAYDDTDFPDLDRLLKRPGPTPAEVWQDIASQMSFDFRPQGLRPGLTLPVAGRLNLPFRRLRLAGGGFLRDKGYGRAQSAAASRLRDIAAAAPPDLKSLALESRRLAEARMRIAEAENRWGNSVDASLRMGVAIIADLGSKWIALEESQRRDELADLDISDETVARLGEVMSAVSKYGRPNELYDTLVNRPQSNGLPAPAQFSWLLSQYDTEVADRVVALWRSKVLPHVVASAGLRTDSPLIAATVVWSDERTAFAPLQGVTLRNTGDSLANVVVEMTLHNGWEERTTYYWIPSWPTGRTVQLSLHPRHQVQRDYTLRAKVNVRYWSDRASGTMPSLESVNVRPKPDAADAQQLAAQFERENAARVRYWGAIAQLIAKR